MRFTILHPSRRPEKANQTISKWFNRYDNKASDDIHYILSIDSDDPMVTDYEDHFRMEIIVNPNKSAVEAINKAANHSPRFSHDIMIVVSDDTDCPDGWNNILRQAIGNNEDFVMKTDDGIQKRIITMPIMDRTYFERDGFIYNPIYSHSWADTELTEVAHLRGRAITRMDIKFTHNHYSVNGEQPDDLYKRNDLTHDRDRPLYLQRKKINFGL